MAVLQYIDLGQASYGEALALQRRLVRRVRARGGAFVVLVEHYPPVITVGRRGRPEHVLVSRRRLAELGIELHESARGGQVTYHGPGQLVAYVIRRLGRGGRTVHGHVHGLEEAVIGLLARLGIAAGRRDGHVGVWAGGRKVASIGVAVERWVSYHGLALNVGADLAGFDLIVPCGLADARPTSLSRLLGRDLAPVDVKQDLLECLRRALDFDAVRAADPPRLGTSLPAWLKRPIPPAGAARRVSAVLNRLKLPTVCLSAKCPNRPECFARRTATFMILGTHCTRRCRFCAVESGSPDPIRDDEPEAVAEACLELDLAHVVITSVTRDDLPDGGAGQFARTIAAVRRRLPRATVEVLVPDFRGDMEALKAVLAAGPDVFNHNIETVPRLYPAVRPGADYRRSLAVLARAARWAAASPDARPITKSGLMLGLGERDEEVLAAMADLRGVSCRILTIGQYLAPSPAHLPVQRFVEPAKFDAWRRRGEAMGFEAVAAGPFVRSSYRAEELLSTRRADRAGEQEPMARRTMR